MAIKGVDPTTPLSVYERFRAFGEQVTLDRNWKEKILIIGAISALSISLSGSAVVGIGAALLTTAIVLKTSEPFQKDYPELFRELFTSPKYYLMKYLLRNQKVVTNSFFIEINVFHYVEFILNSNALARVCCITFEAEASSPQTPIFQAA